MGSRLDSIKQIVTDGGPGFCQFAINNACNAGCAFCSFNLEALPKSQWLFTPLERSMAAIDILARHGIRYLVITGGEPMLHPELNAIVRHASRCGMVVILVHLPRNSYTPQAVKGLPA